MKGGGLVSANATRFTSVERSLTSVLNLEPAFRAILKLVPNLIPNKQAAVNEALESREFWSGIELLIELLRPVCKVVMAV